MYMGTGSAILQVVELLQATWKPANLFATCTIDRVHGNVLGWCYKLKIETTVIFAVNGVVQTSIEKPRSSQSRDTNPPSKSRSFDNSRNNKPTNQDQRDGAGRKFTNHPRDDRAESKRLNSDKTNNRYTAEGRTSLNNSRERESRPVNSESMNHERPRQGFNHADDDRHNSRMERSERAEKPLLRTQVNKQM